MKIVLPSGRMPRLASLLLPWTLVALSAPALTAQEYVEGLGYVEEDEWYDPSDWFDGNDVETEDIYGESGSLEYNYDEESNEYVIDERDDEFYDSYYDNYNDDYYDNYYTDDWYEDTGDFDRWYDSY